MRLNYLYIIIISLQASLTIACNRYDDDDDDLPQPAYNPTLVAAPQPPFFPPMPVPDDNLLTEEGIALGEQLFNDRSLSVDYTVSCANCHLTAKGFTDGEAFSKGVGNLLGTRSSMPLHNVGWAPFGYFWDGRAATLEDVVHFPVIDKVEMANEWDTVVARLEADARYRSLFREAFGTKNIEKIHIQKSIAQFMRTLVSAQSKYDKSELGGQPLTEQEKRGRDLFFTESQEGGADCFHCHGNPPFFTDFQFKNNGLTAAPTIQDFPDRGRGGITGEPRDYGKFKVPSLRDLKKTAPYMHDGRFLTLEEVVEHYATGIKQSPTLDPNLGAGHREGENLELTAEDKAALVAFLEALD